MPHSFWRDKRILITGHEGFLGSHLVKTLLSLKGRITGLDILTNRKATVLNRSDLQKIKAIKGSVEDYQLIADILRRERIEYIFHLAAMAEVGKCLKNPLKALNTNIKGTWNILEASRNSRAIEGVILASSDKAYGTQSALPYKESHPLSGDHPYDASKSCADLLAHTYFHTYNVPACVTRCGNIFGAGDFNFSRIVPDAIRCALTGRTLSIRSDGNYVRDYIYVDDIINGYLLLGQKMKRLKLFGEAFNFSNGKPVSVLELVKTIYSLTKSEPDYIILNLAKYEIKNQYLSARKAFTTLGWKPKYSLEEGLKRTIVWYEKYLKDAQGRKG
jgi:CDP-glucose 4,6-dehydratase